MNKVKFGLRNVFFSKITYGEDNAITYATPVAIPGAVNLSLSPSGDSSDFYADDVVYFSDNANQGYEGDLEIALIPDSFYEEILGFNIDENGAIIESADAKSSAFALGFEVQGDEKNRRTWLLNCTAARPNQDAATSEASKTPSTETLTLRAMPRLSDKKVKITMTKNDTNATVFESFFDEVYEEVLPEVG